MPTRTRRRAGGPGCRRARDGEREARVADAHATASGRPGWFGAYGRLAAWRSLAGISGAAAAASAAEVERQVQECDWFSFDADTKWFKQVAWDIGLAAARPGRQRLAVLAVTGTD